MSARLSPSLNPVAERCYSIAHAVRLMIYYCKLKYLFSFLTSPALVLKFRKSFWK